ncbi:hypothetical protein PUN28_002165 [Cardiocondyla obscurior]|uniref:Partial AB-hydrolase lipase domain-containing protein n=1 Tax=Cardiocondyla obscurior TaxID=286306 RepID=A0AAW2GSR7_9HYME
MIYLLRYFQNVCKFFFVFYFIILILISVKMLFLSTIGLVERYHYPAEEHSVTTEDGYNLVIHRIPRSPLSNNQKRKEIVFLLHGMIASSDYWVLYDPSKCLACLLADQGYDVWVGNMRGNSYCRSHTNMTVYNPKFWQYSFHEVGTKDLPAMFNYILNCTKQKNLYFIGHSMGATSILALLSSKPEYNIKIKIAIFLAPCAFWVKVTPTFNNTMSFLPFLKTALPDLLSHVPAGTSVQTLDHYYQNILANDFRNYDYGIVENYKRYKQKTPPSYDIKKITAPIHIFYAENDMIVAEESILELEKHLPNAFTQKVPYKLFNHVDFVMAIDAKTFVYNSILKVIQKFVS